MCSRRINGGGPLRRIVLSILVNTMRRHGQTELWAHVYSKFPSETAWDFICSNRLSWTFNYDDVP